ncbi:MAG: CDC27 family protein [Sulfurimonas sp.]
MYDIEKLEKEWEAYNKKRHKPKYIVLITSFLLILGTYLFWEGNYIDKIRTSVAGEMIHGGTSPAETNVSNLSAERESVEKEAETVPAAEAEDTLPVIVDDNIKKAEGDAGKLPPVHAEETNYKVEKKSEPVPPENPFDVAKNEPVIEEAESLRSRERVDENVPKRKSERKVHINIIEIADVVAYKDIEDRFDETREIEDSLFLARSYFNKGNYKKAEYWALQTNKVDDSIEESWLIFAKSKVKLGHKNEAIKILELYLKKHDSRDAVRLLEKLK